MDITLLAEGWTHGIQLVHWKVLSLAGFIMLRGMTVVGDRNNKDATNTSHTIHGMRFKVQGLGSKECTSQQ